MSAVANPFDPAILLTEAIVGSIAVHVANDVRSWVALFSSAPDAENCWVVPGAILAGTGVVTVIVVTGEDENEVVPVMPVAAAVITAVPVIEPAVTSPCDPAELLTDAMAGFDELHVTKALISAVLLFE